MEFFKKLLPVILVAIIFAVGGYFIGKGSSTDQSASLFKASLPVQQMALTGSTPTPALAEGTSITTVPGINLAACVSIANLVGSEYWYDGVNAQCHLYNALANHPITWSAMIDKATCGTLGGVWQKNKTIGKMECVLSIKGAPKTNNYQ